MKILLLSIDLLGEIDVVGFTMSLKSTDFYSVASQTLGRDHPSITVYGLKGPVEDLEDPSEEELASPTCHGLGY